MDRLDLGVARGIITVEQRDALRALDDGAVSATAAEARHGFNGVTVAYWTGGIAVLSAFGWFLVSRWTILGPSGVLVVALVYAVLLATVARVLAKQGFVHAAAVTTVLVVGMAPIIAWSLLSLTGWWDPFPVARTRFESIDPLWNQVRWLPIDLATILAALIALRRVKFGVLALPIAAALAAAAGHAIVLFIDVDLVNALGGRPPLLLAIGLLSIAYAIDSRNTSDQDYALWFYLAGLAALVPGLGLFWVESAGIAAHATLAVAIILAFAAIRLHRRLLLFAAFLGFIAYLGYLAFDVFKKTLQFPVALATIGIVVILSAVWLQRRYPALVRRMERTGPRTIPGAWLALGGAGLIALVLFFTGIPAAQEKIAERYWRERVDRLRSHNRQKYPDHFRRPAARPRPTT